MYFLHDKIFLHCLQYIIKPFENNCIDVTVLNLESFMPVNAYYSYTLELGALDKADPSPNESTQKEKGQTPKKSEFSYKPFKIKE